MNKKEFMDKKAKNSFATIILDNPIIKFLIRNFGVLIVLAIMVLLASMLSTTFFQYDNFLNILRQLSTNMLLTFSLTLCILAGSIDLSVGPVVSCSGIVFLACLNNNVDFGFAIVIAVIFGIIVGLINGIIIAFTDIPPFIVTLSVMYIVRGIGYLYTNSETMRGNTPLLNVLGRDYVLGFLPISLIVTIVIGLFCFILLYKTRIGTHIYALGGNAEAAVFAGINIKKIKIIVHTLSGTFAAVSGIFLCAKMYSATARIGVGYEADAIAGAVLGGVSFSGGRGTLGGAVIGALVIAILKNGMTQIGITDNWQFIMKGLLIIISVVMDTFITARKKRNLREANS